MSAEFSRLIRFGVTGFIIALVYVGGYTALFHSGLAPFTANLIAFGVAVVIQYVMQTRWTFQRPLLDGQQSVRFLSVIGIGMVYSSIFCSLVGPSLDWRPWVAAGTVAVTLPVINYISFRLWVYRPDPVNEDS